MLGSRHSRSVYYCVKSRNNITSEACRQYLGNHCTRNVQQNIEKYCPHQIIAANRCTSMNKAMLCSRSNSSLVFSKFTTCLKKLQFHTDQCVPKIEKQCKEARIQVLKLVRLTMESVRLILKDIPSLRVIHFLRDPRAIVASRLKVKFLSEASGGSVIKEAALLCQRMLADILMRKDIESEFPHNFLVFKYEDFVVDPMSILSQIYLTIDEPVPDWVKLWTKRSAATSSNSSSAGFDSSGAFDTVRRDSANRAYNWRKHITADTLSAINIHCEGLLKYSGYEMSPS